MSRFFVDAETDGLYGAFLSVAALVTDEAGDELAHFYAAVRPDALQLRSDWVKQNVLPFLGQAEQFVADEAALLEAFWAFWMRHREEAECVADVGVPVEARLFTACVLRDLPAREFLGPYPLHDLSTLLRARGLPVDEARSALSGLRLPPHDPLNDVRMAAALWNRLCDAPMPPGRKEG